MAKHNQEMIILVSIMQGLWWGKPELVRAISMSRFRFVRLMFHSRPDFSVS